MFSFCQFKFNNIIYYIFILIKVSFAEKFIDMKKLYLYDSSYFVVLDTGLYLYDFNNNYCFLIHKFQENEYRDSNNIIIEELYYGHKAYIFCLFNEFLFILNEYTYKIFNYKINEINSFQGNYYHIMPYKIENNNNISFIIAFNNETTNLYFYYYKYNLDEGINEPKIIKFNNMNIQNKMIRCQINSYLTFIICFYYLIDNSKNYFTITIFNINDMNLIKGKTSNIMNTNIIKQIKLAKSFNDKFFVCFLIDNTVKCLINDNLYKFKEINCRTKQRWTIYKVFYLNKIDDFMLISQTILTSIILNNVDNSIKKCEDRFLPKQEKEYSIIYINDYQVVNYKNFSNHMQSKNILILENVKKF